VQIWQAGCDGKYPYVPLKNKINHKIINLNPESSFVGSGTAVTNNLGEFSFITMLPVNQSFNYINARVMAKNFQTTQTKWFVDNKLAKKLYDMEFKGDNNYYFDIIIPKLKN
jgi:protocatechuate 3,4-dioxygenase beta subunit